MSSVLLSSAALASGACIYEVGDLNPTTSSSAATGGSADCSDICPTGTTCNTTANRCEITAVQSSCNNALDIVAAGQLTLDGSTCQGFAAGTCGGSLGLEFRVDRDCVVSTEDAQTVIGALYSACEGAQKCGHTEDIVGQGYFTVTRTGNCSFITFTVKPK